MGHFLKHKPDPKQQFQLSFVIYLKTKKDSEMKRSSVVILTGLLISLNLFSQSTEYKIKELISAYAENGQLNGTILVKKGENIIYKNAFGLANREWNIPNTLDSKFLAGSIGKSITAFMTLLLVNDGLIDLNATINEYIPYYSGPGKNKATIHQMLTHTSGVPDHGAIPNLSKKLVRWSYNTDQYLTLIKDLDLKRAYGYEYHLLEGYMNPFYIDMSLIKGSGGILTTVEDLAKFNNECFNTQKLLSKDLFKKMFTRHVNDWQYYGYGWWITDRIVGSDTLILISHGGSTDGYKGYSTRILNDSIDIILFQNNYYRTELGAKFDYAITGEIIETDCLKKNSPQYLLIAKKLQKA